MPDFDNDLKPVLLNRDQEISQLDNPLTPNPKTPYLQSVQARQNGPSTATDAFFGGGPKVTEMAPTVSIAELNANKRYGIYNPETIDIEDQKANAQSNAVKAASGVLKGLNLAATTVAGGFAMLGGTVQSMFTGRLADIWDNEGMRKLDEWNNKVDQEYLPNYYTNQEKNAAWYSTDNWFTTNFLFDKLIKNSGFAVGAMVSGNLANAAIKGIGAGIGAFAESTALASEARSGMSMYSRFLKNTARAFSAGKNIEAASVLENGLSTITELDAATSEMANIARQASKFGKINDVGRRTAIAMYSQAGEASFEAMQTSKEYRNNLIEEWKRTHNGEEPNGEDLAIINRNADNVGKMSFFGNIALLSATEYAQLPKILGSSYSAEKQAANSLMGNVKQTVMKDGKLVAAEATTKFGKMYDKVSGVTRYVADWKEGLQENLQYALQVGTQRYYNKAYQGKEAESLVDSMIYGLVGVNEEGEGVGSFNSKEGMEGTLLGAITGGLMQARGTYVENRELNKNTAAFLQSVNEAPTFKEAFIDRMRSVNRGVTLQQQQQQAVIEGDKLESKDLSADMMHNYLATRIKYGRFDMVAEDIKDLREAASTEDGLASLKEQGIANMNDTIQSYNGRLTLFEKTAEATDQLYKSLNLRYSGDKNFTPEVIDKLAYASSKIANYELRIPQVNAALAAAGINTFDVLDSILTEGKPNKQATKDAIAEINKLDTTEDEKDELKTALSDVIEMSLRRKLFISEYNEIRKDPETYQNPVDGSANFDNKVTVRQNLPAEEQSRGKRTTSKELEIGKEYSLSQPIVRNGNKLTIAPKITVLSKTLGGEYEVRLPNGQVSFITPQDFKNYDIASTESEDPELTNLLEKAISNVLGRPEFANTPIPDAVGNLEIPETTSLLNFVNESDNQALTDAVEAEFAKISEDYLKEKEEQAKKRESLEKISKEIKKFQDEENKNSAFVPTPDSSVEEEVKASNVEPNLKDAEKIFSSTSSASVEGDTNVPAFVTRFNKFMNAARNFKNRSKLQAIMFTYKQQDALGLSGAIEMAWGKQAGQLEGKALEIATNVDTGNVMVVFVQVDKNGKQSFIDADGNVIGTVGEQVDVNKIVVSNMATADLKVGNYDRYRESQKEEATLYLAEWKKKRAQLFNAPADSRSRFTFTISKGKPIINEENPENNSVAGTLVSEDAIAKEKVLEVNTKDTVSHPDGNNYSVPAGRPYIIFGDMLQIVNNNTLNANQAQTIYSLLKDLSDTFLAQSEGARVVYEASKRMFLRNVLFMNDKASDSPNQVYLSGSTLRIAEKTYDLASLDKFEKEIIDQLQTVYHTVNNKTLNAGLAKEFVEYYTEGGELKTRTWKNYQSYLLSGKTPDGKARNVSNTPITTSVATKTDAVPYNYTRKYVTLEGLELVIEKPVVKAEPKPAAEKTDENEVKVFPSANGDVLYTVTTSSGKLIPNVDVNSPGVQAIVADAAKLEGVKQALLSNKDTNTGKPLYDELDSPEEMTARLFNLLIRIQLNKVEETTAEETKEVEEQPIEKAVEEATKPQQIDLSEDDDEVFLREAGTGEYEEMNQYDIDTFKAWAKKNLPTMPYEYLDNMIRTLDGKNAFGKLEKGIAYIMKTGARGTEYHEAFHFVFNGFLSKAQRQELINEFKSKPGSFTDRASGKKINYADATNLQAEERIADDFADFRLGKLSGKSLGESIRNFFKAIVDFFKSVVTKPGKIEELFEAIDRGDFAERAYPQAVKRVGPRYSEIPGMSEQQVNEIVEDMTARLFSRVFANNQSLFNPEKITSKELFSTIKESNKYYRSLSDSTFKSLVSRTKDFLKTYRIEFDENSAIEINDETASKNEYASDSFTVDFKKSSPYAVKLLIGTLVKTKPMNQTTSLGLEMPEAATSDLVKGARILEFNKAFATLLNHFENVKDPQVFVEKLVDLARENSDYVRLFARLKGNLSNGTIDFTKYDLNDWRLFVSTFQVFTKQKPEVIKQFLKGTTIYTGSAVQVGSSKDVQEEWTSNIIIGSAQDDALIKKTGNYYTIDKEAISKSPIGNPTEMVDFLNKLGIAFSLDAYKKIKGTNKRKFSDAVSSIKKGLATGPNTVNSIKDKRLDITKGVKELANLYVKSTSVATSTILLNSEGEQRQEFTDSNAPSYFEYMFNSVSSLDELMQKMPQLNDTFSTNSQILKKGGLFFDEDGERTDLDLKVGYIDGVEDLSKGDGKSTSSLSVGDRFVAEINQNINGNYYVLIPADGSTEWMMNMGNQIDYELFSDGQSGLTKAYEIFQKYLVDEINLAKDWKNREKLALIGDKAKQLRFFNQILSPALVNKAETVINEDGDIDAFIAENTETINESIKNYINGTVEELKQSLIDNNQVVLKKNGNVIFSGLLDKFAGKNNKNKLNKNNLTQDQLNNILTFLNTNYIINNTEFHKVLFGDPYQFKIKDGILDETKRIKSFLSPRRFTFNMTQYNNKLNTEANTVDGEIALSEDIYGYHQFKDYLKTFTVTDVNLVSSLSSVFASYGGTDSKGKTITINETDASSWISPTAYREVKMKNGQWSDEAEAFHQWQMAYTRRYMPGDNYKGNLALQAHDIALTDKPMPKYFIDVLKPIVSGNKFNKNTIDLVLDKFSQVPIYYSAVKGTNLESLFKKMFEEKADYVVVQSGRKVGAETLYDLYKPNGEFNNDAFTEAIEVPWEAYGIQVENSYDKEKLQTRGSQLNKLATLDLYSSGEPIGDTPERQEAIKNAVERNAKALDNLVEQGYVNLLNKLGIVDNGDGTFKIVDKSATSELLRQSMFNQQMSINAIDSVTLNDKGEFTIPFEASTNYSQIKNILYSAVNKSITSPKMSGFPGVQISAALWENASEGRQLVKKNAEGVWENISKEQYEELSDSEKKKVQFTSSALKFYEDEEGKRYCEVLLPNWIKSKFNKSKFKTDEEILEYLKTADGGKILKGIGFRIPTQALSSVEVFKIKGFLPEYMGRSVVVPSEITTKSGSDFDIDKLNMYLRAIYTDAQGDVRLVESRGSEEQTKNFYRKVYEDTIEKEMDTLSKYDDFRDSLTSILEQLEALPSADSDSIYAALSEEDLQFYAAHQQMFQTIVDQANDQNVLPSDYMKSQIETLESKKDEVAAKLLNTKLRNDFVNKMYEKSLENEYYDSLEELLTLPENFKRLVNPNTDATLKELSVLIDELEGVDETTVVTPMLNRTYLTNLRHSFLTAKKWVGIAAVNITGNSLVQKTKVFVKNPDITTFLPHNKVEVNGLQHMTISKATDTLGKYISDKLSEYANAFVDVAKDPYILKIIYSERVVGSFMLLERLGVPTKTSALFMNQPIIKNYIKYLDSTNKSISAISNKDNIQAAKKFFTAGPSDLKQARLLLSKPEGMEELLSDMIKNGKSLGKIQNALQQLILDEFIKITDLASANFKMTQAINYDTTNFKNSDELYRKNEISDLTREENVFNGVDEILNSSFIGKIKTALNQSTRALGEVMKFNQDEYRAVIQDVLKYYALNPYIGAAKFNRIAEKASASFLDYIIYTKGPTLNLKDLLVDKTSVANRVLAVKEQRKDIKILDYLIAIQREGATTPTKTLKLRSRTDNAFDENMLIGYMREMRNDSDPAIVNLYNDIVKLAITQGSNRSPSAIKSIVPLEDYSRIVAPIINNLVVDDDIRNFAKTNYFQKNYFTDPDVSVEYAPKVKGGLKTSTGTVVESGEDDGTYISTFSALTQYGEEISEDVYLYHFTNILTDADLGASYDNRALMKVHVNSRGAGSPILVVPRIIKGVKGAEGDVDFITGETVPSAKYDQMKAKDGEKIDEKFGYEKVVDGAGNPVIEYGKNGNNYYIYRAVNLYGDPGLAVEYDMFADESVLDNNTRKIDSIIPTNDIIRAYSKTGILEADQAEENSEIDKVLNEKKDESKNCNG